MNREQRDKESNNSGKRKMVVMNEMGVDIVWDGVDIIDGSEGGHLEQTRKKGREIVMEHGTTLDGGHLKGL